MPKKTRPPDRPRTPPAHNQRLEVGHVVVPDTADRLRGADPFTRLVVTAVNRGKKTVDLATLNGGPVHRDVDPRHLTHINA